MSISSNRDDPLTIQLRFISVISTSIISTLFLMLILPDENVFFQLGFYLPNISSLWKYLFEPLLLTTILFLGPITHNMLMLTKYKTSNLIKSKYNLITLRNYIVAPLTEEYIFRGVIFAILTPCISNAGIIILISSLLFGISHSHHYFFQSYMNMEINPIAAIEQMTFTTIFGCYASLLYLRTKFIFTPILVHSFCNLMEFPDFATLFSSKFWSVITVTGLCIWIYYLILFSIEL